MAALQIEDTIRNLRAGGGKAAQRPGCNSPEAAPRIETLCT